MSKKIALIVGAYPPDACGIGDYSYQLVHSDIDKWICIIWKEWNLTGLLKLIRKIKKLDTVYVNLQYPTKSSYGSLMPHLLCIYFSLFTNKRFMITLHEFMRMSITYRLAAFLFLLFANMRKKRLSFISVSVLLVNPEWIVRSSRQSDNPFAP